MVKLMLCGDSSTRLQLCLLCCCAFTALCLLGVNEALALVRTDSKSRLPEPDRPPPPLTMRPTATTAAPMPRSGSRKNSCHVVVVGDSLARGGHYHRTHLRFSPFAPVAVKELNRVFNSSTLWDAHILGFGGKTSRGVLHKIDNYGNKSFAGARLSALGHSLANGSSHSFVCVVIAGTNDAQSGRWSVSATVAAIEEIHNRCRTVLPSFGKLLLTVYMLLPPINLMLGSAPILLRYPVCSGKGGGAEAQHKRGD